MQYKAANSSERERQEVGLVGSLPSDARVRVAENANLHYDTHCKITRKAAVAMLKILPRVAERHPDMTELEVGSAWEARARTQYRLDGDRPYMVAVGVSAAGGLVEIIAFEDCGNVVVFHAMRATKKTLRELGMM